MEDRKKLMAIFSLRSKNMKKLLLLFCITSLLLASCVIMPKARIVYDKSIAVEKTAWICPENVGTITGYNGIEVKWKFSPLSFGFIQIPAGNTLLEWELDASVRGSIYRGDNILFRYNFLPGKQYFFVVSRDPQAKEGEPSRLGLKIYMYNIGESINGTEREMEKHYYGFAPFLNIETNRRTILE
jgi:hypothetical protein